MNETVKDADFLRGKQVAFTGRLASMTRREAAQLVRTHGGRFVADVNRRTAYLIVGQEGWPLCKDGRLTNKLRKAGLLQHRGQAIAVLSEEELLTRLGLDARSDEIRRLYTLAELSSLLKVRGERLRSWISGGLMRPVSSTNGVAYFGFQQATGAKTLCELIKAGVTPTRIRRSLEHLKTWTDIDEPLAQLALLEKDGELLVRTEQGLADTRGQLHFDFTEHAIEPAVAFSQPSPSAAEWFALATQHEEDGRLAEAENAYRQALLASGPDGDCCFNLANVLYALGRKTEAAERFHQVVEMNPRDAAAWNNLGIALADLERFDEAKAAYSKALELGYTDAHYNLADLLDENGEARKATVHWQAYVRQDSSSSWAGHARSRLNQIS